MTFNDAHKDYLDLLSQANETIDAAKYGHLHSRHIGDRVAYRGGIETVLFVTLNSVGTLDAAGHGHLRFPSEVAGPLPLPRTYVQGAARRVSGRSSRPFGPFNANPIVP